MPFVGIGVGVGRQRFAGGFDADYQAVLDYATTQGYTLPSSSQQILQNQLVLDLKSGGIWSKLDTFGVFANDGGSNFGLICWKRKVLMTAVNSPTFTTNQGFTGNGTSSYIDTNFNPATQGINYTRTNASRYYMHYSGTSEIIDGIVDSGSYNRIILNTTSGLQSINSVLNIVGSFLYTSTIGVKSIHRTTSTNVSLFNDKIGSNFTQTDEALRSSKQFVLRRVSAYSTNTVFGYAMGASLISENNTFVDSLNNYINSL